MSRSSHSLYAAWKQKVRKCIDPRHPKYHRYGGRGITMHPLWLADFWAFVRYVDRYLGPRPPNADIDRVDNDGGYTPGNIQWLNHGLHSKKTRAGYPHGNLKTNKLTQELADQIRELCRGGEWGIQTKIARQFGIDTSTAHRILTREYWR